MGVIKQIEVSVEDRLELERIVRAVSSEVRMVERARIVLAAAEGLKGVEIAERVGCSEPTVVKWRGRYAERGIEGLKDAPRSGAPLTHGPETRALLIAKACTRPEPTAEGARRERWTYEELGAEVGMSASQAHVILQRAEIKPHRTEYWMMSDYSRPEFEERLGEICGLYIDPPENVLVVSIDEKTGIQAKAPTKPDQPPQPGKPARREHEYTRNGTQCLFACLNVQEGDSWLNQIEIFFSILWRRLLKHGIFTSEADLACQMLAFVETYNQTANPFKWTYTGKVLEA